MTSLILSGLLLAPVAAQVYMGQERDPNAFTWVQPLNTTILGQYGHSEPVYPSPHTSGAGWKEAYDKARDFVAELTLEEKSDMVTGVPGPCIGNIYPIPRLNFSGLCLHDGPVAIRAVDYSSTFPSGVTVAASWDKALMYERYLAMGREFRGKGAHVALAPSVGPLGRVVFGGRNWEGFSPDPYLSGDAGVQAVAKHWLANEQETARNPIYRPDGTVQFEALSSNLDDRTTHELYMWPFANAVHANAAAVMCSYQRINGSYACQNSKILNGLMKKELGFQGYIMSDWYAVHSGVASVEAGLDMDMPGTPRVNKTRLPDLGHGRMSSFFGGNITIGVNNGTMSEARLNDMIERIMSPYFHLHQDQDFPTVDSSSVYLNTFSQRNTWFNDEIWDIDYNEGPRNVRADHPETIRRHAAESTVLLKNINNALPLKSPRYLGIFGNGVGEMQNGPLNRFGANESLEYGTYAVGGGSGAARLSYLVTPLEALHAKAREDGTLAEAWLNNTMISTSNVSSLWSWRGPDACLVFLKGWAREVVDREFLDLDYNGNGIVESVARQCNNTIVITHSAGSNNLPFADHPNVTGILLAHYPGEQAGNSIVDVLYGKVNPSGRLPYTVAYNESDWNAPLVTNIQTNGTEDWQSWFDEGLEIDYRYFDAHNISVRYPFGFGLSYTTFGLSDINIKASRDNITSTPESAETIPGGNPNLWKTLYTVEAVVRNTGSVAGSAVPQLYVSFPDSVPDTPPQQLRGFEKIQLGAGESRMAKFELMRRDISFWDIVTQQWVVPEGEFTVSVGFSSRDLIESATVNPINGSG
ncbi:probable beta-glucosidase precursor [Fusarium oxysporum]|uniref:Beta-glucosidase cel3A n=1 Tax=Fusarium oxysporum TaxID=5507 RepID=A0A2H3U7A5_FUSOX|nr:probable beta-glucosidase precursor [Fusarium oxysporum]